MSSVVAHLTKAGLIKPPPYASCTELEVIMGSYAYGCSSDTSDMDIYALCIPPKNMIFSHLRGEIDGFGPKLQRFEQYMQHHISDPDGKEKSYDIVVYNIVKYFDLCMGGNPNMIDSLYVPERCVIHATEIGRYIRSNRSLFLSKKIKHSYLGYAYAELHKVKNRKYEESHRRETVEKYGYDPKNLYHVRRLLGSAEQILLNGDLDVEKDREALKAIRRGDVSPEDVQLWVNEKEKYLEKLYAESDTVPMKPNMEAIKNLLIECLEMHFGSISEIMSKDSGVYEKAISEINTIMKKYGLS